MLVDRREFLDFIEWLDQYYRSPEGLQRPKGLMLRGSPDFEAVAAWGFDVYLNARRRGVTPDTARQLVRKQIEQTEEWKTVHPSTDMQQIGIQGRSFTRAGEWWQYRGFSSFLLFVRYLLGHDIAPIVQEGLQMGANTFRTFLSLHNIIHFDPPKYPDYFTKLSEFVSAMNSWGANVELVVFADRQLLPWANDDNAVQRFFTDVVEIVGDQPNVFIELVNEAPKNGIDPDRFQRPTKGIVSRGSGLADQIPPTPPWSYITYHPARDNEWPRKMKNGRELADAYGVPVITDEPMGAGEEVEPGRRDNDPTNFYDAGVVAGLLADATFHSENGLRSEPLQERQRECAKMFFNGMLTIPPEVKNWSYTRGGLPDCPVEHSDELSNRTFVQYTDREAWGVAVSPQPQWRLRVKRGQLVETFGYQDHVFHLKFE